MTNDETTIKEYQNFAFPGYESDGACFLRVCSRPGGLLVLCSQLLDYHGISVTNGAEKILIRAIEHLRQDICLDHLLAKKSWWQPRVSKMDAVRQISQRTKWVEHYPAGSRSNHYPVGSEVHHEGSFALVAFDGSLRPIWNYASLQKIAMACEVDPDFFKINEDKLRSSGQA